MKALVLSVCVLLGMNLPNAAQAQCSTGSWSSVSGSPQALGNTTTPKGSYYEGECGLTVDAASPGYVTTDTPLNEDLFTAQLFLNPGDLVINSGEVVVLKARDGATVQVQLSLRKSGSDLGLVIGYRSNGSFQEHGEVFLLQPVWQAIAVGWSAGSGNGTLQLKVDSRSRLALSNLNNAGEVVNEVDLGITNQPQATGKLVMDAFEMRRTKDYPALPELAERELFSISTRARVSTGAGITVAGFIIKGSEDKCVVIRGRGPSVGVREDLRLADPVMELKRSSDGALLGQNDDWQTQANPNHVQMFKDLGMAPSQAKDSALYTCLPEGAYTALLSGKQDTTGIGIVEVIDADTGLPYLGSISTRARVKTGAGETVAGFIIEGDQPKIVVIRGRGPSVGIRENLRLPDPTLTLKSLDGTTLAENDNWGDLANVDELVATGMAPASSLDAALLIELQPGIYTAILRGANDSTGVGIVEVIDRSPR